MLQKYVWADIIRILAIFLILVLHVTRIPNGLSRQPDALIFYAMVSICVPLLVMLSGSLILIKTETYKVFFQKRLLRVLLPWITWTIIFTIIVVIYNRNAISLVPYVFHSIFIPLFWFMPMIFGLYCLSPALRIFVSNAKTKDIWFVFIIWFISISFLPYFRNTQAFPVSTDSGLVRLIVGYSGYFILGYLLLKIEHKLHLVILFLIFILGLILSSLPRIGVSRLTDLGFFSPGTVLLTSSVFSLIYLSEKKLQGVLSSNLKKVIAAVSSSTFGIFMIHYLFINRYPLPPLLGRNEIIDIYPVLNPLLNGLIIFTISFFIIFTLQQLPVVKKFIA